MTTVWNAFQSSGSKFMQNASCWILWSDKGNVFKKRIFTEEKHRLMYSKWSEELNYFHKLSPRIANKHYDDDNNENN